MSTLKKTQRLTWTRSLAEQYWQGVFDARLHMADGLRATARHLVFAMAVQIPASEKVTLFLERSGALDDVLRFAGFTVERIDAGPRNQDGTTTPQSVPAGDGTHNVILVPEALAQLIEGEVDAFFSVIRASLRAGGRLILTVPNNEILDQFLAIDPLNGTMFHTRQRVRSFTPNSLEALLTKQGFQIEVLQQLELSDRGFATCSDVATVLANEPRRHVGSGDTLFVIARRLDWNPEANTRFEGFWLNLVKAARRLDRNPKANRQLGESWLNVVKAARLDSFRRAVPFPLLWTKALTDDFWSLVAGTPLDDLSFGRINSAAFMQAVSFWLKKDWRYLDFGAGNGSLVELMLQNGYSIAAFEPAEERRKMLDKQLMHFPGYLGSIENVKNVTSFECVIATEVIEHISDDQLPGFLDSIWNALTPGGCLLLTTPHREQLEDSVLYSPASGAVFHRWQHLQSWSADRLSTVLEERGFRIEGLHRVGFSAIASQVSPYVGLILGQRERGVIGDGETLLCIARRPPNSTTTGA